MVYCHIAFGTTILNGVLFETSYVFIIFYLFCVINHWDIYLVAKKCHPHLLSPIILTLDLRPNDIYTRSLLLGFMMFKAAIGHHGTLF